MIVVLVAAVVAVCWWLPAAADPVVGPVIAVGSGVSSIAVDATLNRTYVVDEPASTVFAIDGATNAVAGSAAVPARANGVPHELAVDPATHRLYVTEDFGFSVVDGATMRIVSRIATGATTGEFEPAVVAPAGRIYALRVDSVPGGGPIVRLLVFSQTALLTTVDIGAPPADAGVHLAVDADPAVNRVYVTNVNGGQMAVVDGQTNKPVFVSGHGDGDIEVDPLSHRLLIVDRFSATLFTVDPVTNAEVASLSLGPPVRVAADRYLGPIAVDTSTHTVYVSGGTVGGAGSPDVVTAVSSATNKVLAVLPVKGTAAANSTTSHAFVATPGAGKVTVLLGDSVPPETTITAPPAPTVTQGSAISVRFAGTDNVTAATALVFQCSLDSAPFASCTSPFGATPGVGSHQMAVRATDLAGNVDPSPAVVAFSVVAVPGAAVVPPSTAPPASSSQPGQAGTGPAASTVPQSPTTAATTPSGGAAPEQPGIPPPVSGGSAAIVVRSIDGRAAGPPGVGLRVSGSGFSRQTCPMVYVFFGRDRIGTVSVRADGSFDNRSLAVPGDLETGIRSVAAACRPARTSAVARAPFTVEPAAAHRTVFVSSLHTPSQVPRTLKDLGISALVALVLLAIVVFPSELFDSTLSENYEEVCGWFGFARPLARPFRRLGPGAVTVVVMAVASALYGLLSPGFGLNTASLAAFVGMVLSLVVVAVLFSVPSMIYMRRRFGEWGSLDALPAGIAVAAACVALSRILHFQPGYIYGVLVGVAFASQVSDEEDGRLAAMSTVTMLAGGLIAWVLWSAVARHSSGVAPSPLVLVAETMLAAVAVSGLETAVITMFPLRFMAGSKVMRWSRSLWGVLFLIAAFAFVDILLRPGSGYVGHSSTGSVVMVAVLFGAYAVGSFLFWGYFRFRRPRPSSDAPVTHRTV